MRPTMRIGPIVSEGLVQVAAEGLVQVAADIREQFAAALSLGIGKRGPG